jgi:hypothetical protein
MNATTKRALSNKWVFVLNEYELIKQKNSKNFSTVDQLCEVFKIHRKDIRKYYGRWIKSGRDPDSLLPQKRGPKPGQLKLLSKDEERTIIKIRRKFQVNEFEISHMIKRHLF